MTPHDAPFSTKESRIVELAAKYRSLAIYFHKKFADERVSCPMGWTSMTSIARSCLLDKILKRHQTW